MIVVLCLSLMTSASVMFADTKAVSAEDAVSKGLKEKAKEFRDSGGEVYVRAD